MMIPAAFEYAAPASLEEAIGLLEQYGDDAKILAGGHSLIPLMRLRLAIPAYLVDLGGVEGLSYIRDDGDYLAIGSMTTHYSIESSDLLKQKAPLLPETAALVGDMQVRNRGTIGGSLAHADPAADFPSVVTALNGNLIVRGPSGEREIGAADFFEDVLTTVLEPSEIVTEIRIPHADGNAGHAYEKFRQRAADWALVGAAVSIGREDGSISRASVVLANVGSTPVRAQAVEDALRGAPATAETARMAAEQAAEGLEPPHELKASPEYKRHLARVLTRRALERALNQA